MNLCFFLIYTHSILVYYSFRHQARLLARQIYFGCCGMRRILVREEDPRSRPRISPAPAPHRPVLSRSVLGQVLVLCCARFPTLLYDHHYTCIYCMYLLHISTTEETNNTALGEYRWYYLIYTVERLESSTRLRGFAPFPTCWTLG